MNKVLGALDANVHQTHLQTPLDLFLWGQLLGSLGEEYLEALLQLAHKFT